MAQFATVDCLHIVWLKERDIQARLEEGGRLVRGVDGATFVKSSEDDCIENSAFLKPYMVRQRGARSLDVPDLDALKHQLLAMHTSFALNRAKTSKRPRALLEATVELVQVNAHLDAKALKRLFSYARQRYLKPHTPKDLYGKGGKKTRWDSADADEVAGMEDAFEEHPEDLEDAEEEEREVDPVVDVAPFPEPVSDPRCLVPSALQRKDAVVHMNSSASISSDATTLILGETGTPKTPKPIKDLPGVEPPSGQITPSPPSDPAPRLVYKEVLYVAESPRKLVKAELHDEANEPTRCQPDHMDKLAAMQELAMLEARLKERKMTNAAEAPPPEPEHKDASEDELAPTEPDQEEPTTEQPEQMDKQAAMHELALLQAQLPQLQLRSARRDAKGNLSIGPVQPSEAVLDTDETQAAAATVLDMEVISREEQLDARKKRKDIAGAKRGAKKDHVAKEVAPKANEVSTAEVDQATAEASKAHEGPAAKVGQAMAEAPEATDGQPGELELPATKKRRTAAKTKPKPREQEDPEKTGDAVPGEAKEDKEPVPGKSSKKGSGKGRGRGKGKGRGKGRGKGGKGRGNGKGANKANKGKSKRKNPEASEAEAPARRLSKKTAPEDKDEATTVTETKKRRQEGQGDKTKPKKQKQPGLDFEEEKIGLRKLVVSANGSLTHYVIMIYWTRPGVGIKQVSDGKQVQYLGMKGVCISKLLSAAIDCVA
ncbi:unnamed protein product [Symbiodinium sp. KB8]|nr:unnamed protein product [Symbiodinium sp. KB8]